MCFFFTIEHLKKPSMAVSVDFADQMSALERHLSDLRYCAIKTSGKCQELQRTVFQQLAVLEPVFASWPPLRPCPDMPTTAATAATAPAVPFVPVRLGVDCLHPATIQTYQMRILCAAAGCSELVLRKIATAVGLYNPDSTGHGHGPGPGWLNVRTQSGLTPLYVAAEWGCLCAFRFLFCDLRVRAPLEVADDGVLTWQKLLVMDEDTFTQPLLLTACSAYHQNMFRDTQERQAYEINCSKIAALLASELPLAELTRVWRPLFHGDFQTTVLHAAHNDYILVLQTIKDRVDSDAWTALITLRQQLSKTADDPRPLLDDGTARDGDLVSGFCSSWTLVGGTALINAARNAKKRTVAWLLANATWSSLDIAAALQEAGFGVGSRTCQQDALEISMQLAAVLVDRKATGSETVCGDHARIMSRLLSRALSQEVGRLDPDNDFQLAFVYRLLDDLDVEMLFEGSSGVFDNAGWCFPHGVRFALEYAKAHGKRHVLTAPIDNLGTTLLMAVAESEYPEVVQVVVDAVCALDPAERLLAIAATNAEGRTAAQIASSALRLQNLELFEAAFGAGSLGLEPYKWLARSTFVDDSSPLTSAVYQGLHRVVAALLQAGADPLSEHWAQKSRYTRVTGLAYESAMEIAIDSGTTDMFRQLVGSLDCYCPVSPQRLEKTLRKCLLRACYQGFDNLTRAVLETLATKGYVCLVNSASASASVMEVAVANKHTACVAVLEEFEACDRRWSLVRQAWVAAVVSAV